MAKTLFKIFFAVVVIPGVIIACLAHLNKKGFFNLQTVTIELAEMENGTQYLEPQVEVLQKKLEQFRGQSLWNLSLKKVETEISQLNWVKNYNLYRRWPQSIVLKIEPHEVKMIYLGKNNKFLPVIQNGQLLDPVEPRLVPDVALLNGDIFQEKKELRKKAVDVLDQIPKDGSFNRKNISEVHFDPKEGFWMTMVKQGLQVKLGEEGVALKSARVSQVIDYLENKEIKARVIDANLSKKVLVKVRKNQENHVE